jgi:hypothetical protein
MKIRMMFVLLLTLALSLSLTFAQKTSGDSKATTEKSCCMQGAKADKAVNMTKSSHATIMLAGDKKLAEKASMCTRKGANGSMECTDAEKAACPVAKKASMMKAGNKMDCCKDKAKMTKAEKKTQADKAEAKGTN